MTNQVVWGLPHVFAIFLIVAASGALNLLVAGAESSRPQPDESLLQQLRVCLTSDRRPLKEITAEMARELGISKRLLYQEALKIKKELSGR